MSNIVSAQLPSEDEEDDDYDPTLDKTAEKEDLLQQPKPAAKSKRTRGALLHQEDAGDEDDLEDEEQLDLPTDPASLAKRRKAMEAWASLNGGATARTAPAQAEAPATKKPLNLAALCKPAPKKDVKSRADMMWMKGLGLKKPAAQPPTQDIKAAAAHALHLAKAATALPSQQNKVTITETRRFAGRDITLEQVVDADSNAAKKAAAQPASASGLDAVLQSMAGAKKVNVLDKTRHDWSGFKRDHAEVEAELEGYKKSNDKYLEKVEFLQRAELREYEAERDKRLASDIRTRGRA